MNSKIQQPSLVAISAVDVTKKHNARSGNRLESGQRASSLAFLGGNELGYGAVQSRKCTFCSLVFPYVVAIQCLSLQ